MPQPRRGLVLGGILVAEVLIILLPAVVWAVVALSVLAFVLLAGGLVSTLRGRTDILAIAWVSIFPLGYYFLSFPRNGVVVSYDRVMVLALLVAALLCPGEPFVLNRSLRRVAVAWALFVGAAFISMAHVDNFLGATKLWWDLLILPSLLGFVVIRSIDPRRLVPWLHFATCFFSLYCVAVGLAEAVLNTDLLPLPVSTFYAVGETTSLVPRVNGPFSSNHSYSLIGLIAFFLILFLRRQLPERLGFWRSSFHYAGLTASFIMAVMTLYRSIFLTLVVLLIIDTFMTKRFWARMARIGILSFLAIGMLASFLLFPAVFEERSDPTNVYGRVAQQQENLEIFLSHPITGIGFGNFLTFAAQFATGAEYEGSGPVDAPHSNLAQIVAETGVLGAIPYLASQCLLVAAFWKLRKQYRNGPQVWLCFLQVFLTYWITGLSLSSGYASDLNLWFIFTVAFLYKFAVSKDDNLPLDTRAA